MCYFTLKIQIYVNDNVMLKTHLQKNIIHYFNFKILKNINYLFKRIE